MRRCNVGGEIVGRIFWRHDFRGVGCCNDSKTEIFIVPIRSVGRWWRLAIMRNGVFGGRCLVRLTRRISPCFESLEIRGEISWLCSIWVDFVLGGQSIWCCKK